MKINGACYCGVISFTAEIDPSQVVVCHCTDCQVLSGSPFRAVVATALGRFSLRGTPKSYVKVAESGNRRAQMFCPECGTPLYGTAPDSVWHCARESHLRCYSTGLRRAASTAEAGATDLAALEVAMDRRARRCSRLAGTIGF